MSGLTPTQMEALLKWMSSPAAEKTAAAARDKTLGKFKKLYSNADMSKFTAQVDFDANHNSTAEVYFKAGPGYFKSVFGSDSWSVACVADGLNRR